MVREADNKKVWEEERGFPHSPLGRQIVPLWLKVVCGKVCQRRERSARNGHGGGRAASESRVGHKWMNETMAKITPPSPSSPLPIEKGLAEKDGVFGREAHPSRVSANMAATVFNVEDLELEVTKLRAREAQ